MQDGVSVPNAQSRCSPEFVLFAQEAGGPPDAVGPGGALGGSGGGRGRRQRPWRPAWPGVGEGKGPGGRGGAPAPARLGPRHPRLPSGPTHSPIGVPGPRRAAPLRPAGGGVGGRGGPGRGRGMGLPRPAAPAESGGDRSAGTPRAEPLAAQRTGPAAGRARWLRCVSITLSSDTVTARSSWKHRKH